VILVLLSAIGAFTSVILVGLFAALERRAYRRAESGNLWDGLLILAVFATVVCVVVMFVGLTLWP